MEQAAAGVTDALGHGEWVMEDGKCVYAHAIGYSLVRNQEIQFILVEICFWIVLLRGSYLMASFVDSITPVPEGDLGVTFAGGATAAYFGDEDFADIVDSCD